MEKCINILNDSDCCGCRACENVCPKQAIKMVENTEGFLYPKVDKEKCINCGLCKKVCPWLNKIKRDRYLENPICYSARAKNVSLQLKGSSGGIFGVIAKYVIRNNGVVVGAEMLNNFNVRHTIVDNEKDLENLYGSKYVTSDLNDIFLRIKKILLAGKMVLFTGVPCQVAGLLNFLEKKYDNLITIDLVCHGTPNQKLFKKYISYIESKENAKIIKYYFRNKKAGKWGLFKSLIVMEKNGKRFVKKINANFDPYYSNFLLGNNYRESCYVCNFANQNRISDITLGDFWGIENVNGNFYDSNGVSAVIINTISGKEIWNKIKEFVVFGTVTYEDIIEENKQLMYPTKRTKERDNFYKEINNIRYFYNIKTKKSIKNIIKNLIPVRMKIIIKKYIKSKGERHGKTI